jgi:phosphate acetyltransferase
MKLVQILGGANTYGQIFTGLSRPVADIPRGASPDNIAIVAALVGLQAIEYRSLYPADNHSE